MIARLRGRLDSLSDDAVVVDVAGVGYLVHCASRTLAGLPRAGEAVDLHVETQVRAESITLYGFLDPSERAWFRLLQSVQGVGARVALAILSVLSPTELARAVAAQDKAALGQASGVGPRLAARVVAELKDRAGSVTGPALGGWSGASPAPAQGAAGPFEDALSALAHLGYGRSEAHAAVAEAGASLGPTPTVDALIKGALKTLSAS